jgi:Rieske Fe-S protein
MNELSLENGAQGGLPRRSFIKHFVVGTAFSSILGRKWFATVLADCQPISPTGGILQVRLSDFPALQNEQGSVRLALNPFTESGPTGIFYPVLVNRGSGNQFFALNSRCTHMNCVVPPFDASFGSSVCPCHSSQFRIDGTVIPGSPAGSSLQRFTINFDGSDLLCIEIPNLKYSLTGSAVESTVGPRFRLQFAAKSRLSYQILFRQSPADPGTAVQFASTQGGGATSTVFSSVTNTTATVYVDRTAQAGFYSVAVQVTEG